MQRGGDEEAALQQLEVFLEYVQSNLTSWKAAPAPPAASEGPALPPAALEQLALIGAQSAGPAGPAKSSSKIEREMALARARAAEKAQHQGFPTLPPSRRLDGTLCYYCQRKFPSRMALFTHLRKNIDKDLSCAQNMLSFQARPACLFWRVCLEGLVHRIRSGVCPERGSGCETQVQDRRTTR